MARLNWQTFNKIWVDLYNKIGGIKTLNTLGWLKGWYIYENGNIYNGPADVYIYQLNKRLITLPGTTGADKTKWKCQ